MYTLELTIKYRDYISVLFVIFGGSGVKKVYKVVGLLAIILAVVLMWLLSKQLLSLGYSSEEILEKLNSDVTKESEELNLRDEESLYIGESIACVYNYFNDFLPEVELGDDYEVKDLGENNYCVYIGDWYIFVKNEYSVYYPYRFCKVSELSDYELDFVNRNGIELEESEEVYSWEV